MHRTCRGCQNPLTPDDTSFIKDGLPYCCAGCAQNVGCSCARGTQDADGHPSRPSFRRARAVPPEAH